MNRNLKPIDENGLLLDKQEQWLEDHAQAVFYSEKECLDWDYFDRMNHKIEEYNETYYILEEEETKVLDMLIDIKTNNGGATIKDNKKVNYDNGYQVCTNKNSEVIFENVYDCEQYIKDNGLKDYGLWFDSGKCYLDTSSVWIESKSEAIKIGKENNQLSIYDWNASESLAI